MPFGWLNPISSTPRYLNTSNNAFPNGERHCSVVREVLLDQHMAVEICHLPVLQDADGTEGTCGLEEPPLCNIGAS